MVKLTMLFGQIKLVNGAKILPPIERFVPDCPSEEDQSKVVPAKLELRLTMFEFPGEHMLGDAFVAVTVVTGNGVIVLETAMF